MTTRPTFRLVLRADPRDTDKHDEGAIVRFRRAIKVLGRAFGLRVLDYSIVTATEADKTTEAAK